MCEAPGCSAPALFECGYSERLHRPCGTAWCPEHGRPVYGRGFCPRHGAIVAALAASGDFNAEAMSDITSVAPALLLSIAAGLDVGLREILAEVSWRYPGCTLLREELFLRNIRVSRQRIWGASWKLFDATGALASVILLLPEHDPATLDLRVDHRDVGAFNTTEAAEAARHQPAWASAPPPAPELVDRLLTCVADEWEVRRGQSGAHGLGQVLGSTVEHRPEGSALGSSGGGAGFVR